MKFPLTPGWYELNDGTVLELSLHEHDVKYLESTFNNI
jgi:hypothetical protein